GLVLARDANAFVETQKQISVAREKDIILAQIAQCLLQFERKCERYGLLQGARDALRSRVDAAVAGVDDDPERSWTVIAGMTDPIAFGGRLRRTGRLDLLGHRRLEGLLRTGDNIGNEAEALIRFVFEDIHPLDGERPVE